MACVCGGVDAPSGPIQPPSTNTAAVCGTGVSLAEAVLIAPLTCVLVLHVSKHPTNATIRFCIEKLDYIGPPQMQACTIPSHGCVRRFLLLCTHYVV